MHPRPMGHRHLDDPVVSVQPDQRGQEPVHAAEYEDSVEALPPDGAQGAADIGDTFARDAVAEPVSDT